MEITLEEIQKKFESLPENLKWAIMGANVDDNIIDVGKEQNLNVEQMGQLSLETYMEMFGFTPPEKFEESVQASLKLPTEKTHAIVETINEKIFKKIREGLGETPPSQPDQNQSAPEEEIVSEEKTNAQAFSAHGIEIIPEESTTADKEKIHSILTQKLSGPVNLPPVKTEHSLQNLSSTTKDVPVKNNVLKTDPYREIPE
jgi:hypothetical protein